MKEITLYELEQYFDDSQIKEMMAAVFDYLYANQGIGIHMPVIRQKGKTACYFVCYILEVKANAFPDVKKVFLCNMKEMSVESMLKKVVEKTRHCMASLN